MSLTLNSDALSITLWASGPILIQKHLEDENSDFDPAEIIEEMEIV